MPGPNLDNYVPVAERLALFYEAHPDGRIVTNIIEHDREKGFVLIQAFVYRGPEDVVAATGHAYEVKNDSHVNKTSYIENCETGAVGRALANLGLETKRNGQPRQQQRQPARAPQTAAKAAQPKPSPAAAAKPVDFDKLPPAELAAELQRMILLVAAELGYDRAKVDRWVDKHYETEGGLDNCGNDILKAILLRFHKQLPPAGVVDAALTQMLRMLDAETVSGG